MKIFLLTKPEFVLEVIDCILDAGLEVVEDVTESDYLISYMHPKKLSPSLLTVPKYGALNFHPAPLPEYAGLMMATNAIMTGNDSWEVTCHSMTEEFDTGDIVAIRFVDLNTSEQTALEVDEILKNKLLGLLEEVLGYMKNGEMVRAPQDLTKRKYYSRKYFEENREIKEGDDWDRKIRAYHYPPHKGAYIVHKGKRYYPSIGEDIDSIQ